jgi:hypothetical protein
MKRILSLSSLAIFFSILAYTNANAQSVGISSGSAITPSGRSILELRSTSKGLLIPRMTAAERAAISGLVANPNNDASDRGMLVFQYDGAAGYYYWDGTAWVGLLNSSTGNFVDLTTTQTAAGAKTWSNQATFSAGLLSSDGVAATPAIAFASDVNTGVYRIASDIVGVSAGGSERMRVTTLGVGINGGDPTATNALVVAGKVKSTGINETSDGRLKKNIMPITSALSKVLSLEGVTYDWRREEFPERNFLAGKQYGLIAQELEKIIPELVDTDEEGWKSIEYSHLVPVLIEAIKEQQAIIANQQLELTSLKSVREQVDMLKACVELLNEHIRTSQK